MPPPMSEHGPMIDHMLAMLHLFMLALFVGWSTFFVYTLIRFRRRRNPKADHGGVKNHTSSHLEVGVIVVEAMLLLGFAFPLWAVRVNDFPESEDTVRVRVYGYQYGWLYQYPGPDGKFGRHDPFLVTSENPVGMDPEDPNSEDDIVESGVLNLPLERPAILYITSKDVIHNYAIPKMRIAQDANPSLFVPMWFTPVELGTVDVICGQLCGGGHANMANLLTIMPSEEWNAQYAPAPEAPTDA